MIVKKFGGTSIATPKLIRHVADMLPGSKNILLVLSAIAGTTNTLGSIASHLYKKDKQKASELTTELEQYYSKFIDELFNDKATRIAAAEMAGEHFSHIRSFMCDMFTRFEECTILAQGELISTALFKFYCDEIGLKTALIPALDFMRIDPSGDPDLHYLSENLGKIINNHKETDVFITQGYICRNAFGEIDNLKRGGSDYTATLIAAALNVESIEIWSDVDGMCNIDPSIVTHTRSIDALSYTEAAELAYFGARILHPYCVQPVQEKRIPLILKNTLNPENKGTLISANSGNKDAIKAVAAKDDIIAIKIRSGRMLQAYGFLRNLFEVFERYQTPIDLITTSEVAVSLTIDQPENLDNIVNELKLFGHVEVDSDQVIICIVGDFLEENHGYAAMVFNALKDIPVRMVSYGGSKNNISLLVNKEDKEKTLLALNNNLFRL